MKQPIQIIDRNSRKIENEQVWGESSLHFLYGKNFLPRTLGSFVRTLFSIPIFSKLWGAYHDLSCTKKRIAPFCKRYGIDTDEFVEQIESFNSFNDFFVRRLKPSARPIDPSLTSAVLPADARYHIVPNLSQSNFLVKGQLFDLESFLKSKTDAEQYEGGFGILARLCPTDCHRFVFPVSGIASSPRRIAGSYLSVSPIATKRYPSIFWTNVREITFIESEQFGKVAMVEIGATNCASIIQTYRPGRVEKGSEKGYFRLGGSAIMLLFEKGRLNPAHDLIDLAESGLEIRGLIGQILGTSQALS